MEEFFSRFFEMQREKNVVIYWTLKTEQKQREIKNRRAMMAVKALCGVCFASKKSFSFYLFIENGRAHTCVALSRCCCAAV